MQEKSLLELESEETRRWRRVREELYARFKTPEELFAWLRRFEKQAGTRRGKARAHGKAHPAAPNGRPANGKPVHKA